MSEREPQQNILEGLKCEEPSVAVRQRVLASARTRTASVRRRQSRKWFAALGLAAGGVLAVGLVLWSPPDHVREWLSQGGAAMRERAPGAQETEVPAGASRLPAEDSSAVRRSIEHAIDELRDDFAEIDGQTENIPPEREAERRIIRKRLSACLRALEELERQIGI